MTEILNSLETLIAQKKAEEAQFEKELAWYKRIKELSSSDVFTLTRKPPVEVSKFDHYNNIVNEAYLKAASIGAKYFIVAANWLPIFNFAADFEMTRTMPIQGSYVAGTYKGLPIIVSPCLGSFEMIYGADAPMPEYDTATIDMNKFMFIKLED
jgi:hypothetical protein